MSGWWDRWIALLLYAYPKAFRTRFGADLAAQYPAPARRTLVPALAAARELVRGGLGARADDLRTAWRHGSRGGGLDGLRVDVVHAARSLVRRPWFAGMVVATLSVAAGLNAAVFGMLDATLLRPLPYPDERALVSVGLEWDGVEHSSVSLPEYVDFGARARAFESIAVYSQASMNLAAADGVAERLEGASASASFFEVLGVTPVLGRTYSREEDAAGARVVVLSHGFWTRRFGADPRAVGQDLAADDGAWRIVGVMPPAFALPSATTDVWIPISGVPGNTGRGAHTRQAIGRLSPDVPLAAAADEMAQIAAELAREYPASYPAGSGFGISLIPLRERLVGDLRDPLQLLMTAVFFVLLIACANVANLMVARSNERARETATRLAVGAPRFRLVRQSLVEGTVVGAAGGAAGVLLAAWLLGILTPWLPDALPRPARMATDPRVIAFALIVTAAAGALASTFTAFQATHVSMTERLKGTRATADHTRARAVLTTAQIALSVMLLVCGGFAARSFMRLLDTSPGLRTEQIVTARISLAAARYPDAARRTWFLDRVHAELRRQPAVASAGAISILPLSGSTNDWMFGVDGWTPSVPGVTPSEQSRVVHGEYFDVIDIPLKAGRLFSDRDNAQAPRVAIVSELLARKYWPAGDAVGRRIKRWGLDSDEPWTTVVGVVGDIRHLSLDQPPVPFLYFPAAQIPWSSMTLLARLDTERAGPEVIAGAVRAVDPEQPAWSLRTMDQWLSRSIAQPRLNVLLLSIFASQAVLLAAVGIYGVMASGVSRRTREFGIRAALGAEPASLKRRILREGAMLAAGGIAIGGAAALLIGRSLGAVFYDIRLADPLVLTLVPLLVFAVALAASYLPARRAMRTDPVVALRSDG